MIGLPGHPLTLGETQGIPGSPLSSSYVQVEAAQRRPQAHYPPCDYGGVRATGEAEHMKNSSKRHQLGLGHRGRAADRASLWLWF